MTHHTCTGCHRALPREAFRDSSRKIRARCNECRAQRRQVLRAELHCPTCGQTKPGEHFKDRFGRIRQQCNTCRDKAREKEARARYGDYHDPAIPAALRAWR